MTSDLNEKYPECAKLQEVTPFSQKIGEFVDWLRDEHDLVLARWDRDEDSLNEVSPSMERLLAEFFDIDLAKVDAERRAILAELRGEDPE